MARSLGTLTVDLLMKTGQFETDSGRAARIADKRAKEIKASFEKAGVAIGAALAAGATAAGVAIKSAIDRADELSKAAQKIGVSTEALSALEYAARLSDVSLQQLSTGVGKLSQNMVAAVSGNKQLADTFGTIGVSVAGADGSLRSADRVLSDLADVFQTLPDGTQKTALAMELFGKAGRDLIPLLNGGADGLAAMRGEAETLGLVLSGEAGKAAEEFNDKFTQLFAVADGLATRVAADLVPTLNVLLDQFIESSQETSAFAQSVGILTSAVNGVVLAAVTAKNAVEAMTNGIAASVDVVAASYNAMYELANSYNIATGAFNRFFGDAKDAGQIFDEFSARVSNAGGSAWTGIADAFSDIAATADAMFNPVAAATEATRDNAEASDDLQAKLKQLYAQRNNQADADKAATESLKKHEDALKAQRAEFDKALAAHDQFQRSLEDVRAELDGPLAVATLAYNRQLAEVRETARDAGTSAEDLAAMEDALAESFKRTTDEIESQRGPVEQMLEDLRFEASLIGLTNDQREKEIALRQLGAEATAEQRAEVVALLGALQDEYNQGGAIAQMFEESLSNVKTGIADSIEDAIFDGAEAGFDSAKRVFEQFARDIVKQNIILPIQSRLSGGGGDLFSTDGNTGMGYLSSAIGGYGMGRSIGGVRGGNAGAVLSTIGYGLGGPVGSAIGSIIGGMIGSLTSKPPDIRLGGATGNVRKPEGSTSTAFGELIYGARGLEGGESEFIDSIKDFDRTLYDLIDSTSTGAAQIDEVTAALSAWELDLKGDNVTADAILGSRFDAILGTFDQSIQDYVNAGTTLEDRIARFEDAVLRPDRLNSLMEGIATAANMAALNPFEQQMSQLNTEFDAARDAAEELGATQAQLAEIEGYRAEAIERLRDASMADYAALVAGLDSQLAELAGMSEFQLSLRDIAEQYSANVDALNAAAQAAGMASAREEDLARALQLSTLQRGRAILALQAEGQSLAQSLGYTALSGVEAQIAALEQQESAASQAVQSFGDAMGDAASSATDAINLLLGDLSPYKDRDKLQMAMDAQQQGLIGPEEVLRIAQRLFASGSDYNQVFAQVMAIGDRRQGQTFGGFSGSGTAEAGISPEMQALLDQRDALLAQQEAAQRQLQAGDLASIIADIAGAQGIAFDEAAQQLGIADIASLAADLGIDLKALNDYLLALQADSYSITDIAGTITAGEQGIIDTLLDLFGEASDGSGLRSNLDPDATTPISADEPIPIDPDPIVDPIIEGGDRMIKTLIDNNATLEAKVQTLTDTLAELLAQIAGNTAALPAMAGIAAANQSAVEAAAPRSKRALV